MYNIYTNKQSGGVAEAGIIKQIPKWELHMLLFFEAKDASTASPYCSLPPVIICRLVFLWYGPSMVMPVGYLRGRRSAVR